MMPRHSHAGFTLVEIAISLAIIGIALVSIIGVLPIGLHTQQNNRQETLINQDATVFLEAIRGGARGLDDLTNYVFAITNYWYFTNTDTHASANGTNGYTFAAASASPGTPYLPAVPITNGLNIIGLLSTPEFIDTTGQPIPDYLQGGYSNHIVAYVRSISGLAAAKPPQSNPVIRAQDFSYRLLCVNAPGRQPQEALWDPTLGYSAGASAYWEHKAWQMISPAGSAPGDQPGVTNIWSWVPYESLLGASLRELRLTFFWPLLANNALPGDAARQTFRTAVAGDLKNSTNSGQLLYFFAGQNFRTAQ